MNAIFNLYKYQFFSALVSQLRIVGILLLSGKEGLGCFSLLISTTSLFALPSLLIQNNSFQSRILQDKSVRIDFLFIILVQISFLFIIIALVISSCVYLNALLRSENLTHNYIIATAVVLTVPFFLLQTLVEVFFTLKNDIKCYQQSFILTNTSFIVIYLFIRCFLGINSLKPVILAFSFSYIFSSIISLSIANTKHYHLPLFSSIASWSILAEQRRTLLKIFRETASLNVVTVTSVISDWTLKLVLDRNYGLLAIGNLQIFQSVDSFLGSILAAPSYKKVLFAFSTRAANMSYVLRREMYVTAFPIVIFSLILIVTKAYFSSNPSLTTNTNFSILLPLTLYLLSKLPSFYLGFLGQVFIAINTIWPVIILECASRIFFPAIMIAFSSLFSFNLYSIPISALLSNSLSLALLWYLSWNKCIPSANLFFYSTR